MRKSRHIDRPIQAGDVNAQSDDQRSGLDLRVGNPLQDPCGNGVCGTRAHLSCLHKPLAVYIDLEGTGDVPLSTGQGRAGSADFDMEPVPDDGGVLPGMTVRIEVVGVESGPIANRRSRDGHRRDRRRHGRARCQRGRRAGGGWWRQRTARTSERGKRQYQVDGNGREKEAYDAAKRSSRSPKTFAFNVPFEGKAEVQEFIGAKGLKCGEGVACCYPTHFAVMLRNGWGSPDFFGAESALRAAPAAQRGGNADARNDQGTACGLLLIHWSLDEFVTGRHLEV